ncbi:hypothetical protein B0H69_005058 [Clostridium beijerinckii]|nr:hypothetical protein [Clostridium beijerinckii]NSB76591.1 hypothetical protein [Clostridium beijerinckii]NYC10719.1 hypothetical protein [Clostridium beijerinckii]
MVNKYGTKEEAADELITIIIQSEKILNIKKKLKIFLKLQLFS